MAWMCSWIGVRGADKVEVLDALNLVVQGFEVEPGTRAAPFSCCERTDGWLIVFSEDFDWARPERVRELSRLGLAVGCQFEDEVEMTSIACVAEAGAEIWRVCHVNEEDLEVAGDPPAEFAVIRDRLLQEQAEHADADYLHDLPLELAKSVCGFRADEDEGVFFALSGAGLQGGQRSDRSAGLLDKLLPPFRRRRV